MRDKNIAVRNVTEAFSALQPEGGVLTWSKGSRRFPSGGHLQSIQRLSHRPEGVYTYVVSASAGDHSFFIIFEKQHTGLSAEPEPPDDVLQIFSC